MADESDSQNSAASGSVNDGRSSFDKHFGFLDQDLWAGDYLGETSPINWNEFMQDLSRCPQMAFYELDKAEDAEKDPVPIIYYLSAFDDTPADVFEKILQINPSLIDEDYAEDVTWNLLNWANHIDISPGILRCILQRRPDFAILENVFPNESFLTRCIREAPNSMQIKTIVDICPKAVVLILTWHYSGWHYMDDSRKLTIPTRLLTYAFNHAVCHAGTVGLSIFDTIVDPQEVYSRKYCLVKQLFECLTKEKSRLMHRYLKIFVKARQDGLGCDFAIDQTSLTSCILYLLAKWVKPLEMETDFDRVAAWKKYVDVCGETKLKSQSKKGAPSSSSLYTAIRLDCQWNPVIQDIVKADPSVLGTVDVEDELLPFMVAATTPSGNCDKFGASYSDTGYRMFNTLNNTYELLRTNPEMIQQYPMLVSLARKKHSNRKGKGNMEDPTQQASGLSDVLINTRAAKLPADGLDKYTPPCHRKRIIAFKTVAKIAAKRPRKTSAK